MEETTPEQLPLFIPPDRNKITHILKRDGRVVAFNKLKIFNAIFQAARAVGGSDRERSAWLTEKVVRMMNQAYPAGSSPTVEEIQDMVEKVLIENGHAKTAKAFILYRHEHQRIRSKQDERIVVEDNIPYKILWKVFTWNVDHECETVEKLNRQIGRPGWKKLVAAGEKAYHAEVQKVSTLILKRLPDVRLVIVAGPSSSGKTTTTTKISERLKAQGIDFVLLNLDNYFRNLEEHPRDEYGDYDFERPEALDIDLINDHLEQLLDGKTIRMPVYNFKTGKREEGRRDFRLKPRQLLLIDSLHGLYEPMTQSVPPEAKFKFYIETLCQIKDAQGEFVRWADLRLLRRMVRDDWHRSYDPLRTVGHWHYVRRSEMSYIVPFMNTVDYIFNGALPYELPYYKRPLFHHFDQILARFKDDPKKMDSFIRARRVHDLLASLGSPADDSDVPRDSLLREFIGGSSYAY
jgi:uridine kinase